MQQPPIQKTGRPMLIRATLLTVAYVIVVSILTHVPIAESLVPITRRVDKLGHFSIYAVMAFLIVWALGPSTKKAVFAFVMTLVIASIDELGQAFVPSREVDFLDWVCSVAGAAVGAWCYLRWSTRRRPATSHRQA